MATIKLKTCGTFRLTTEKKWNVVMMQVLAKSGLDNKAFLKKFYLF